MPFAPLYGQYKALGIGNNGGLMPFSCQRPLLSELTKVDLTDRALMIPAVGCALRPLFSLVFSTNASCNTAISPVLFHAEK